MKCADCGGAMMTNVDGGLSCRMCGRAARVDEAQPVSGLEITIRLRPKNLPELYAAVATAEGKTTAQLLATFGLTAKEAKQVASGAMVHPGLALAMMQKYTIAATDFVALMKAGAGGVRQPQQGARRKGGRPPKNAADRTEVVPA